MHLIILTRKMKRFADVVDRQLECLRIIKKFDLKMHDQMLRVYDDEKRSPLMLAIEEGNSKVNDLSHDSFLQCCMKKKILEFLFDEIVLGVPKHTLFSSYAIYW